MSKAFFLQQKPVFLCLGMNWVDKQHPDSVRAAALQQLTTATHRVFTVGKNHATNKHHIQGNFFSVDAFAVSPSSFLHTVARNVTALFLDYVFMQPAASYRHMYGQHWTEKLDLAFRGCPNLRVAVIPYRVGCDAPGTDPDDAHIVSRAYVRDLKWMRQHHPLARATDKVDDWLATRVRTIGNKTNDCLDRSSATSIDGFYIYFRRSASVNDSKKNETIAQKLLESIWTL